MKALMIIIENLRERSQIRIHIYQTKCH